MNFNLATIDLSLDGVLSAYELRQFGNMVNNKFFMKVVQSDFVGKKFKKYACTPAGLT